MTVISTLETILTADDSGLRAGLKGAEGLLDATVGRMGAGVKKLGGQLTGVGTALTTAMAPLAAGLGLAVKGALDFDSAMTNVGAVLGENTQQMAGLRAEILAIGATSRAGPEAAAQAFYDIAGGVLDASSRLDILRTSIATSEAGAASLTGTTSALISVMNAFGASGLKAATAGDILTVAVNKGVGTMDELAAAIPGAAAIAANAGVSFQELATAMAFSTTSGFSFSEAATQMQSIMRAFLNPNKQMTEALAKMGYTSGSAALKALGLTGAVRALSKATGGSLDVLTQATGRFEASQGAMALLKDGFDGFSQSFADMTNGATDAAAAIQNMSTQASIDFLKSQLQGLAITIGDALLPRINELVTKVEPVITAISTWVYQNPELTGTILEVVAALAVLGPVLIVVGQAITAIGAIIGLVASGPLLVLGAVAAAIGTNFLGLRDRLQPVLVPLQRFIGALQAGVNPGKAFHTLLGDLIPEDTLRGIENILTGIRFLAGGISQFIRDSQSAGLGQAIRQAFGLNDPSNRLWVEVLLTALGVARESAHDAVTKIGGFLQGLADVVSTKVLPFFEQVRHVIQPVIDVFGRFFSALAAGADLGDAFRGLFSSLGAIVSNAVSTALNAVRSFDFGAFIANVGSALWNALSQIKIGDTTVGGLVDTIIGTIRSAIATVGAKIAEIRADIEKALEPVKGVIDTVAGAIGTGFKDIGDGIKGFLANIGGADTSGLLPLAQNVGAFITTVAGAILAAGGAAVGSLLSGIGAMLPDLGKALHDFVGILSDFGNGNFEKLMIDLPNFLGDLAKSVGLGIGTFIYDLAVNLGKLLGVDVIGGLAAWGGAIDNLKVIFKAGFDWITTNVVEPFQKLILGLPDNIKNAMFNAVRDVSNFILQNQGFFSLLPNGGAFINVANQIAAAPTRDSGGTGLAGHAYVINPVAGPEVFVPQSNGTFYPNADRLMGGGGVQIGTLVLGDTGHMTPEEVMGYAEQGLKRALQDIAGKRR